MRVSQLWQFGHKELIRFMALFFVYLDDIFDIIMQFRDNNTISVSKARSTDSRDILRD